MLFTSRNIPMNYNECYQILIGVTLMWPYKSSHLLVSFNRSSLVNHNLPLGSARFALVAFAFQASDGSDEEKFKSPFEAAGRIKASRPWNDCQHLTFRKASTAALRLIWTIRWTVFCRPLPTVRSGQISPKGISIFYELQCSFSICSGGRVFKFCSCQCAGLCVFYSFARLCGFWPASAFTIAVPRLALQLFPGPGRPVAAQRDSDKPPPGTSTYLWWEDEGSGGGGPWLCGPKGLELGEGDRG